MFIISLRYIKAIDEVERHLPAHIAWLDKYYAAGVFHCSGRKTPRTGGIILAEADSRDVLDVIVGEDPFSQHGVAEIEITEFEPTKFSEKFRGLADA